MRRLRPTDGTPLHRKAAQYHVGQCKTVDHDLHRTLAAQMQARFTTLVTRARAAEDADDAATVASAIADAAELALERTIRNIDGELARLDREDPTRALQKTVFPEGFSVVIDPENEAQLETLPAVHRALKPLRHIKSIDTLAAQLETDEAKFRATLDDALQAEKKYDTLFAEEVEARRAIREQMESAYGRLRDLYKARPAEAERFFFRETHRRSTPTE